MGSTSIRVSDKLADELYQRKTRGESYEDVIWKLIEADDESKDQPIILPCDVDGDALSAVLSRDLITGTTKDIAERQCALAVAYDYLMDVEEASKRELMMAAFEPETGYEDANVWFHEDGQLLKHLPGVKAPTNVNDGWQYST